MDSSIGEGAEAAIKTYRLSWVSYLADLLVFLLMLGLGLSIAIGLSSVHPAAFYAGIAVAILAVLVFVYQMAYLRSTKAFTNASGVWLSRGVLPWEKAVVGVRWQDMDDAILTTGFFSWMFNAYTIKVNHRFTGNSELTVKGLNNGKKAVAHINKMHREKTQASSR